MIVKISIEVPDWVKWVAIDKNGDVCGFSNRPKIRRNPDYVPMWYEFAGNSMRIAKTNNPADWTKELYKVVNGELVKYEPHRN